MLTLNFLEQFAIGIVITLLTELETKVTNVTEKAALQAGIQLLQSLLSTQTSKLTSAVFNSPNFKELKFISENQAG